MLFSLDNDVFSPSGLGIEGVVRLLQHHTKALVFTLMSLNSIVRKKFLIFFDGVIPYISRVSSKPVVEVLCNCLATIDTHTYTYLEYILFLAHYHLVLFFAWVRCSLRFFLRHRSL